MDRAKPQQASNNWVDSSLMEERSVQAAPATNLERTGAEAALDAYMKQLQEEQDARLGCLPAAKPVTTSQPAARVVRGYYSNDDVTILLDGLLKQKGLERIRGGGEQDIVTDLQTGINTRTMVLAPIAEGSEEAVIQLHLDLDRAYRNNIEQVLVPMNIPNIHWYTVQFKLLQASGGYSLEATVHDSLGIRKNSVVVENLALRGIAIAKQIEGNLPKLQRGEFGAKNLYCGGYTARLIANLALDHQIVEAWGCQDNRDDLLRQEDVRLVNAHNPANAGKFGKGSIEAREIMSMAQYMSSLRDFIAMEKEVKLLQQFKTVYEAIPIEEKSRIKSLKIPEDSVELFALVRNLYVGLPSVLKVLFQTTAEGEIEKDETGQLKLDTHIEVGHIRKIIMALQRRCILPGALEQKDKELEPEAQAKKMKDKRHNIRKRDALAEKASGNQRMKATSRIGHKITTYLGNKEISKTKFVGRTEQLREIQEKLAATRIVIIKGAPGVGKTSIAYHCTLEDCTSIWFNAASPTSLAMSYRDFGKNLLLDLTGREEDAVIRLVSDKITNSEQEILFIFDSLEGDYANRYLENLPRNVKLLITTRQASQLDGLGQAIRLDPFSQQEAREYLVESGIRQKNMELLTKNIGTIPQDLSLAVGYLRENGAKTVKDLATDLKQKTIFEITFEKLNELEWYLLQSIAWFDHDFIPEELLLELAGNDGEKLRKATENLENLSLIRIIERPARGVVVPREVQAETMNYETKYLNESENSEVWIEQLLQSLNKLLPWVMSTPDENWTKARLYLPSLESVMGHISSRDLKLAFTPDIAELNAKLGTIYAELLVDFKQALGYKERALIMMQALYPSDNKPDVAAPGDAMKRLDSWTQALKKAQARYEGGNHPDVAQALNNVGTAYQDLGDMIKGRDYWNEALKMRQALYQGNHPAVADSLDNVGTAYEALGYARKGLDYKVQALKMKQALYKGYHLSVAASLNNVGNSYGALGDIKRELYFSEFALEMRQALYKGYHTDVAQSLNNVGITYEALGNVKKALYYKEQALKLYQALYKGDNPDVAASLNNVGISYEALRDVKKGLDYKEQALKMYQALYNGDHPSVAASLNNVGIAYEALGDVKNGLGYYEQALKMKQALYKGDHPAIAASLNNVGLAHQALGDVKKGLDYSALALKMYRTIYPSGNHPDVADSLNNVGLAYRALGDIEKGLDYSKQALKMKLALYQGDHSAIAASLNTVGIAYQDLGDVKLAFDYKERGLKMRYALGGNQFDIATSCDSVGVAYQGLNNYKQAIDYKERALTIRQALYQGNHPSVAASLNNVGLAYQKDGDRKKALDYYERALSMRESLYQGNHPDVATSLDVVGVAHQHLGKCVKNLNYKSHRWMALEYKERALSIRKALYQGNHPDVVTSISHVSIAAYELGDAKKGRDYHIRAIRMKRALEDVKNQAVQEEFKGRGALSYAVDSRFEYYNSGVDQILNLRISNLGFGSNVILLKSLCATEQLIDDVSVACGGKGLIILAPFNLYNEHWVGLLFKRDRTTVEVTYMDSEQRSSAPQLKNGIESSLAVKGYESNFVETRLESQRYSNCGAEVIENFVYYLTGTRATQEGAIYVHSLLIENSLLNSEEYGLKLEENTRLIGFLSNAAPLPIRSIDLSFPSSSDLILGSLRVKHEDDKGVLAADGQVALNLLPAIEQFNRFSAKWVQDKLQQVNDMVYKTTLGFKGLDLVVDSARLAHEPSLPQAKKLALDCAQLHGLVVGANGYSFAISGAEVAYQLHKGEYQQAFDVATTTLSSMALPIILAHANRPYLVFAYSLFVAASTAYNALENAYSFALELELIAGQVLDRGDNGAIEVEGL